MALGAVLDVYVVPSLLVAAHALIVTGPLRNDRSFAHRNMARVAVERQLLGMLGMHVERSVGDRPRGGVGDRSGFPLGRRGFGLRRGRLGLRGRRRCLTGGEDRHAYRNRHEGGRQFPK